MCGSRGGTGGPDPLGNVKNIGFLCNTDPDPLKITNLSSEHSGPPSACQQNAILMAFRWRADVGPLLTILGSSLPKKKQNKKKKHWQSWTKLSGSAYG